MKKSYQDSIYSYEFVINADDVCAEGKLSLKKMMLLFQKIAVNHYTSCAQSWEEVIKTQKTWVLNKIELDILRMPRLTENVVLKTWSRGTENYRGFREFEILCGDTKLICANTSWVYLDLVNKSPLVFPREAFPDFTASSQSNFKGEDNSWRLKASDVLEQKKVYPLRYTDFDVNKHLNNTIYFELLEDYLKTVLNIRPKNIKAIFKREVPMSSQQLTLSSNFNDQVNSVCFENGEEVSFLCEVDCL